MKKLVLALIIAALCAGYLYCGLSALGPEAEAARLIEAAHSVQEPGVHTPGSCAASPYIREISLIYPAYSDLASSGASSSAFVPSPVSQA